MNCPHCSAPMTVLGCKVTEQDMHHCPACGTLRTCDGVTLTPDIVRRARTFRSILFNTQRTVSVLRVRWQGEHLDGVVLTQEEQDAARPKDQQ